MAVRAAKETVDYSREIELRDERNLEKNVFQRLYFEKKSRFARDVHVEVRKAAIREEAQRADESSETFS